MSAGDDLVEKVSAVIADHLAGRGAGMMTGFVLGIDYIDEDGDRSWINVEASDQSITQTHGILHWYRLAADEASLQAIRDQLE